VFIKPIINTLNCTPGFPRSAEAGSRGRPLGSHYGEWARGDRREGDGGLTPAASRETVRNLLNRLDGEGVELNQGDVVLLNDPYISGTHLNDVMVTEPTHASNRLVSYVVNNVDSGFAEITYFGFRVSVTNVAVLISAG